VFARTKKNIWINKKKSEQMPHNHEEREEGDEDPKVSVSAFFLTPTFFLIRI